MLLKFLIPFLFTFLHGCNKNDLTVKPAAVLLTQHSWILASNGIDHNQNNRIEPSEENLQDCEKDNLYHFFMNGSGLWEEQLSGQQLDDAVTSRVTSPHRSEPNTGNCCACSGMGLGFA